MNLSDLRKELKAIGYKFSSKRLSWGKHLTFVNIESGDKLTGNVFTPETMVQWVPLFRYLNNNSERLASVSKNEGEKIHGLNQGPPQLPTGYKA